MKSAKPSKFEALGLALERIAGAQSPASPIPGSAAGCDGADGGI
jgi:hypothetical protein